MINRVITTDRIGVFRRLLPALTLIMIVVSGLIGLVPGGVASISDPESAVVSPAGAHGIVPSAAPLDGKHVQCRLCDNSVYDKARATLLSTSDAVAEPPYSLPDGPLAAPPPPSHAPPIIRTGLAAAYEPRGPPSFA